MRDLDLAKRDMTVTYGDRTFALRAYREAGRWSSVVIEHKTPLRTALAPLLMPRAAWRPQYRWWRPWSMAGGTSTPRPW